MHLQFDHDDEHYYGFVLAKYWLSERYRSDNFWQLAAHGFYHRMAPRFPQNEKSCATGKIGAQLFRLQTNCLIIIEKCEFSIADQPTISECVDGFGQFDF